MTLSTTTSSQELSRPRRGTGALRLVASRLVFLVAALFGVVTLSFLLVSVTPGDPAQVIAGPVASQSQIDAIRADLGLDQPLLTRYGDYIGGLLQGDLGTSYYTNLSVSSEIGNRLPASLTLIILSVTFAAVVGIGVGSAGAYFRGRWQDKAGRFGTSVFQSVPDFFLGLILIYVVFFVLGLAPAPTGQIGIGELRPEKITGFVTIDALLRGEMATFWSAVSHLVLPVMTLGLVYAAYFAKTARSTVGKALNSQQAQFARAMGLPERTVLRYSFVEARGTIVTYAGVIFAALIGGEAIVEQVFAWDGLGSWAVQGILRLDIPVVQGMVLVSGAITLITYTVLDIVVGLLDPRITHG